MKLARKLTLWLVLGISAVLGVHFALSIRREREFLQADTQRHNQLLGRTLVALVREVVRVEGEEKALALIDRANEHDATVSFRWVLLEPREHDAHRPEVRLERLRSIAEGRDVVELQRIGNADRLLTYAPFRLVDGRAAAIEVAQSMAEKQRYVKTSIVASLGTTLALGVVALAITLGAGLRIVGRPMRALADKARRIGEGDLSSPLELPQQDEVGELAREINAMCVRLAESDAQLAHETAARIATVDQLRHAERLAVVGKIASGVAHELGTPLQVISGWAKMIRGGELEGADVQSAADTIASQADRMARSIRGLLDYARRRDAEKRRIDVGDVVRETVAFLQPLAEKRAIDVRCSGLEVARRADVDGGQIQQAVTNLLVNGLDAMERGGTLSVTLREVVATPPAALGGEPGPFLAIEVADTGSGISPDDLARVFDPFFTTKEVGQGTGLGLPVALGIVRDHGGWIDVRSEPARGSTFTIHLPSGGATCSDES